MVSRGGDGHDQINAARAATATGIAAGQTSAAKRAATPKNTRAGQLMPIAPLSPCLPHTLYRVSQPAASAALYTASMAAFTSSSVRVFSSD